MSHAPLAGLIVLAALSGCSSSGSGKPSQARAAQPSPRPSISCPASLRTAFAPSAAAGAVKVHSDVSAGFSTCDYRTPTGTAKACSAATVTINTNPQPFKDFQRWVVETGQNSGSGPGQNLAPMAVFGIGIEADWVPGTLTFETADNERWIAVQLRCPDSGPQSLALAKALARAGLAAR